MVEFVPLPKLSGEEPAAGEPSTAGRADPRAAAGGASAPGGAPDAAGEDTSFGVPDEVIDLRDRPGATLQTAAPRRFTSTPPSQLLGVDDDLEGPVSVPPVPPRRRVSRRVLSMAVLAVVSLLLSVAAAVGVRAYADVRGRSAKQLSDAATSADSTRSLGADIHAGLVELVLEDVSQPPAGLRSQLLELERRRPPVIPSGSIPTAVLARALREQERMAAVTASAFAEGGPEAVASRLPQLDRRRDEFELAWSQLRDELQAESDRRADRASRLRLIADLLIVPGVLVSGLVLVALGRRLRREVDQPIDAMRRAAAAWRVGRSDMTGVSGRTALLSLGAELDESVEANARRMRRLRQQAEWGAHSRMVFEALDLVETEGEAHQVAERALQLIDPDVPVEFLLSPHGSRELLRVAWNRSLDPPMCPVPSTDACPAIRRGQIAVWDSSESINACPKLRDRPFGPCSAVCVPVTVSGRPIGVIHAIGPDRRPPGDRVSGQLGTLSNQLGNRLGALRALESSRQDAATDKLTGLPNRRLLEAELGTLIEAGAPFVLVLADLDRFKLLNDTYGHEIGDKALQLFAHVLRDKVRGNDVVARYGGEEFVLVYPRMSLTTSIEAIERIRDALAEALEESHLPEFTCSFGITHSSVANSAEAILRIADAGLLRAKELGGDQVVFADETLAARMFGDDAGV